MVSANQIQVVTDADYIHLILILLEKAWIHLFSSIPILGKIVM